MRCKEQSIREQLPSYLEGTLGRDKTAIVELHLARCADCAEELALLRMLADEQAPDPGEAFWASLHDRVYHEVRQQGRERSRSGPSWSFASLFLSPWTRRAAAAAAIVLVSWIILRPARELPLNTRTEMFSTDDLYETSDSVTELELSDTNRLASWMEQESLPLLNAIEHAAVTGNGSDRSLDEYLSTLDQAALKNLAASLSDTQEAGS